jgi:hypothetical protein
LFVSGRIPVEIERGGVLLMLATPVVRVIVACFLFFREKDWKYGWISLGVLVILMLGRCLESGNTNVSSGAKAPILTVSNGAA